MTAIACAAVCDPSSTAWARLGTRPDNTAASYFASTPARRRPRRSWLAIVVCSRVGYVARLVAVQRGLDERLRVQRDEHEHVLAALVVGRDERREDGMQHITWCRAGRSHAFVDARRRPLGHVPLRRQHQLVLRPEVVLDEPHRYARFGCDLAERRRREATLHRDATHGFDDLPAPLRMIHSLRHRFYGTPVS